ncbi:hypothetical protein AKJ09_10001 [Labilithrix luteola]|uniref:Uncharacterized protein n=1 Tax=Labilithrix luteola TaxID=1391654 RepID=A0A0K1QC86_9BACT|nr:hypothetical protein [Labilithrix luteola]AKV03338.1 hypothetical protein AKJ09_10001 [Labilithrix luteola]
MTRAPLIPPLPPRSYAEFEEGFKDSGTAELLPRYEDITQDGRVILTALAHGLGASAWRTLLRELPAIERFREEGILPILSRMVIVGEQGPFSVNTPVRYVGTWRFARERNGDRLFLNMWLEARAPVASTFGPTPGRNAETAVCGRIFAEHVITRPFGPPEKRKVTRLEAPGIPATVEEYDFESAESLVGDATLEDGGDMQFGLMHTDSNQHVNSLVYPRLFEEAVVRRLFSSSSSSSSSAPELSVDPKSLVARAVEMRWRKPFFTGDRAQLGLRLVPPPADSPWKTSAIGAFSPVGAGSKPSCTLQLWMA